MELEFEAVYLDQRNWVVDFGGLKEIKTLLENTFDHKTLVAANDPEMKTFQELEDKGLIDMVTVPQVGCEAFSRMIFEAVHFWLQKEVNIDDERVKIVKCQVREHQGNSAYVRVANVI